MIKKNKLNIIRGFSLFELLITTSILMVVSGLVFFNQAQFSNSVLIENLAYEISLVIRQAQSYGIQTKGVGGFFSSGYGVYFDKQASEFILFADTDPFDPDNPNLVYDGDEYDEIIDRLSMTSGNIIEDLCVGGTCGADFINISFIRPDPSAIIKKMDPDYEYDTAQIRIKSPKGIERLILVNSVGQISITTPLGS
ncbi:MAG: prepilin-type N-terminal cleavage/methylation domain-containing protein [Candidatus Pacebacteria bacterium]|nr:prepilin-type N-terminal cleavage/methylation domain-containing protein [Candidatus Paceibacterota bacterium]